MATFAPRPGVRASSLSAPRESRPAGPHGWGLQSAQEGGEQRPGLPIAEAVQHAVHVVFPAQALKEGDEVQQLRVRHVIEPGLHRHGILRVEDVRGRRIVHDDHFAQLPSKATQVFHVVPTMENTRFSEEPCPEHAPAV